MKETAGSNGKVRRVIVLDGSRKDDLEASIAGGILHSELERNSVEFTHWMLRDIEIAPCVGCFTCWTRTPGECVFDDEQRRICKDIAGSDLIILITPISFGGYSSELKKGLDRFIPVLLPFFRKYEGETHHPSRRGNGWNLLGIGTLPMNDEEKETLFRDLVKRNSLNMHSENTSSVVLYKGSNETEIRPQMTEALKRVMA